MALALLGVRLLLALVFAAAAVGKLRDRAGFVRTLAGFGLAGTPANLAATLVPALELVAASLLLPAVTAGWGATLSLALLLGFTLATGISLLRGNAPDCACFGAIGSEPVGSLTLARNALLIVLTVFLLLAGSGAAWTSIGAAWSESSFDERVLGSAFLITLACLGALSIHASRLRSAHNRLQAELAETGQRLSAAQTASPATGGDGGGLPPGSAAPEFDLPRLEGDRGSLTTLMSHGRPVVLIFLSAHCSACHELWPDIERWQAETADRVTIACVCGGSDQTIELKLMGYSVSNVLLEGAAGVGDAYGITLRPSAVVVRNGTVTGATVIGVAAIRALVAAQT